MRTWECQSGSIGRFCVSGGGGAHRNPFFGDAVLFATVGDVLHLVDVEVWDLRQHVVVVSVPPALDDILGARFIGRVLLKDIKIVKWHCG